MSGIIVHKHRSKNDINKLRFSAISPSSKSNYNAVIIYKDINPKYTRIFHSPFAFFYCSMNHNYANFELDSHAKNIASILSSAIEKSGNKSEYIITGAGFTNVVVEADKDWGVIGDKQYISTLSNITNVLKQFSRLLSSNITSKSWSKWLLIGVDVCVKVPQTCCCDFRSIAQVALCISNNRAPNIIWKVYPTKNEERYLMYPLTKNSKINAPHKLDSLNSVYVCNDALVYGARSETKKGTTKHELREMVIHESRDTAYGIVMIHKYDPKVNAFTIAYNRLSGKERIGSGFDKLKATPKKTVFTSGIELKDIKAISSKDIFSCKQPHCDIWIGKGETNA